MKPAVVASRAGAPPAVAALVLVALSAPMSLGVSGPVLVLDRIDGHAGLIVTAFGAGTSIGTAIAGAALGRLGPRGVVATCASLLALGAALTLTGPNVPVLALAALLQSLGAAGFTVLATSLARSAVQVGAITGGLAVVGSSGPLVGQAVADLTSWRVTLALPVLALLGMPALLRALGPSFRRAVRPWDPLGIALVAGVVTAVAMMPVHLVLAGPAALVLAALAFRYVGARPHRFPPPGLLRAGRFWLLCGLSLTLASTNFGLLYLSPVLLADQGVSAAATGMVILWPYLAGGSLSWVVVPLGARLPTAWLTVLLPATAIVGAVTASLAPATAVVLVGLGLCSLAAVSGQGMLIHRASAFVPETARDAAIGFFTSCYLLGIAVGPAVAAGVSA
ncbi:MFS transporter [Actinopolymorpha sp. B17G11]